MFFFLFLPLSVCQYRATISLSLFLSLYTSLSIFHFVSAPEDVTPINTAELLRYCSLTSLARSPGTVRPTSSSTSRTTRSPGRRQEKYLGLLLLFSEANFLCEHTCPFTELLTYSHSQSLTGVIRPLFIYRSGRIPV